MFSTEKSCRKLMILSMVIFSTIGILRRYIPYASSVVSLVRGCIGALFLLLILILRRHKPDIRLLKKKWLPLFLSGAAIGFNWILLFEAYRYTSVAVATLCYYMAPIFVIAGCSLLFRERLTLRKMLCCGAAITGMVLVSGVMETSSLEASEIKGVLFGLGAAVLYAGVILINRKLTEVPAYDKTVVQLATASCSLLVYVLLTGELSSFVFDPVPCLLLVVAGILHTGIAYYLYFGAMSRLPSQSVAMLSYIDPVLAVLLSALLLQEPMNILGGIGAVLILGSAVVIDRS